MKGKSSTLLGRMPAAAFVACILLVMMLVSVAQAGGPYYYTARKSAGTGTDYADWFKSSGGLGHVAAVGGALTAADLVAAKGAGYLGYYVSSNFGVVGLRWGRYEIDLPESGIYKVWNTTGATTSAKTNVIHYVTDRFGNKNTSAATDQLNNPNVWLLLGTYDFKAHDPAHCQVELNNDWINESGSMYFGALKFEKIGETFATLTSAEPKEDGTAIDLEWTAPTYGTVDHYIVERSDGNDENFAVLDDNVTGLTYSDSTGYCDTIYYYRVIAVNGDEVESVPSNVLYAVKCASAPPMKAFNPDPADWSSVVHTNLDTQIVPGKLSWTPGDATETQDIYFGTDFNAVSDADKDSPEYKTTVGASVKSFSPGTLAANTEYYWRIDSTNLGGTTKGDVWYFKTGVSVKLVAVRNSSRGNIEYPEGREWGEVSWHEAGEILDFSVAENPGVTWVGWSLNASGSPIFDTERELNSMAGNGFVVPGNNATLYAVFQMPTYTLTLVGDPVAGQTDLTHKNLTWPTATDYEDGDVAEIKVTVNTADKYLFAGWESNKGGTFNDQLATTATYKMTAENTTIKAYAAKAVTYNVATGTRSISANNLAGDVEDWWTTQINVAAYSPTNNQVYNRPMVKFEDWAGFNSFPAQSLLHGLGKITLIHTPGSSYSGAVNIHVRLFEVMKPWVYSVVDEGVWWKTTDGTTPWDTPGGDRGEQLGPVLEWVGVPAADTAKVYTLPAGKDYRYLLRNGIQVKSDEEGAIQNRKGMTKTTSVNLYYNPPEGPGNVIRDWAYLGSFAQGGTDDHQARIDTDQINGTYSGVPVNETQLAAKAGKAYGAKSWAVTALASDILDINALYGAPQESSASYFAVYVNNPGAAIYPAYVALGADDFAKVWTNGVYRGQKLSASSVLPDQSFIGPFTLLSGWNKVLVKVENGGGGHGVYARFANADRTAITGLTYSTSDDVAPSNPTSVTEAGGAQNGIAQSAVTAPKFAFVGATDDKSGVRGYKIYFGTDANGVPNTWKEAGSAFEPGEQNPGTYYLRVAAVDYALNEAAVTTAFTFVVEESEPEPVDSYGISNKATMDAATAAAAATKKFTVWGKVTVIDANSFTVDDGSGVPVKVLKTAHGFTAADYVSATGTLDVSGDQPVLTAISAKKQN
ncbi:MAG: hypothetical protein ACOX3G_03595 [Armatimonadota bacterium]